MINLRGTSIIEIIIAAALISVAIIAALSLMNHSQKQNNYARNLAEATKYTGQAAEWVREQRTRLGWPTLANKITTDGTNNIYCLNSLPDPDFTALTPSPCAELDYISNSPYQRSMTTTVDPSNPSLLRFTITVTWLEKEPRQSTIEMELAEW